MNNETRTNRTAGSERNKAIRGRAVVISLSLFATAGALIHSALADPPQPVLRLYPLGSNQFNLVITNAVSTTNYIWFYTPALANPLYPWAVLRVGNVGETNYAFDAAMYPALFFRAMIGQDSDGDGSPEWQDAQPLNPAVGILSVTIDSPTNGMVLQ